MSGGRWALLALLAAAAPADVNPVRPAAARLLRDRDTCVGFALEVGERLAAGYEKTKDGSVYSGDAGVALLFAGLFRATREQRWLELTRRTLDRAIGKGPSSDPGLYTGISGIGEACVEAWWATKEKEFLERARACAKGLDKSEYAATDIISGAAGTGIFLLNLHAATGEQAWLDAARRAGTHLVETAIRKDGAARWRASPASKIYVGFSHGSAGIGYFLLHLHRATGEKAYRTLAAEAARHVMEQAMKEGADGAHWHRTDPPVEEDLRVQWCHGAPGIGLFFHDLVRFSDAGEHRGARARCVATTLRMGRTARRGGGQCHGVAGNAELFLQIGSPRLLEAARRFGSALLEPSSKGYSVRGDKDPSYMTGLAGMGHFFLRLADPEAFPLPMMVRGEKP